MNALRQRIVATLDRVLDSCVEHWRVMLVLMPAATFVIFAFTLFFGLTVVEALATAKTLAVIEIVVAAAIAAIHFKYRRRLNVWLDAADAIEALISNDDVFSDRDDFMAAPATDHDVEWIRLHCMALPREYPPENPGEYCNEQGIEVLQGYVRRLRIGLATRMLESWVAMWTVQRGRRKRARARRRNKAAPRTVA